MDSRHSNRHPRPLTKTERARLDEFTDMIHYSDRLVSPYNQQEARAMLTVTAVTQTTHMNTGSASPKHSLYATITDGISSHVMLPKAMLKQIPKDYFDTETGTLKILHEEEWRSLGITQSLGWQHYEIHAPEPHILLFKYVPDGVWGRGEQFADYDSGAPRTTNHNGRNAAGNPECGHICGIISFVSTAF